MNRHGVHAHPTLAEIVVEAVLAVTGQAIKLLSVVSQRGLMAGEAGIGVLYAIGHTEVRLRLRGCHTSGSGPCQSR